MANEKDNPCQNPLCFKKCKGPRGLSVHLGLSKHCAKWYEKIFGRRSRSVSPDSSSVSSSYSSKSDRSASKFIKKIFPALHRSISGSNEGGRGPPRPGPQADANPLAQIDENLLQPAANPLEETFMTVESDNDISTESSRIHSFPGAAKVFEQLKGKSILEDIMEDRADVEEEHGMYYPFANCDDFAVGAWLSSSGASMANIDRFLKLPFVRRFASIPLLSTPSQLGLICSIHRLGSKIAFRFVLRRNFTRRSLSFLSHQSGSLVSFQCQAVLRQSR